MIPTVFSGVPPTSPTLVRSDLLAEFRKLLLLFPPLQAAIGSNILKLHLILDANVIQRELRWRVRRRRDPTARSNLHEVIDSSVVVAIAPTSLRAEIAQHIAALASDCGVSESVVQQEWMKVQALIHFGEPTGSGKGIRCTDPDDTAYAILCLEVAACAVYSSDAHFETTGVPLIRPDADLDTALRDYARGTAVTVGVKIGATLALTVSFEVMASLLTLLFNFIKGLPAPVKIAAVLLIAAALVHPSSRKKILELAERGWQELRNPDSILTSALAQLIHEYALSSDRASKAHDTIVQRLPLRSKGTLLTITKRVFITSARPLHLKEIDQLLKFEGYYSTSIHHKAYLKRVLRTNPQFIEVQPGLWQLQSP